ncbi:hypothetical protein H8959_019651 [Pygathrix nigripes]
MHKTPSGRGGCSRTRKRGNPRGSLGGGSRSSLVQLWLMRPVSSCPRELGGARRGERPGGEELSRLLLDDLVPTSRLELLFGLSPCLLALRAARRSVARLLLQVHQGVCMEVSPLRPRPWSAAGEASPGDDPQQLWLVLEGIQDPRNFGAVLRSAHFLGVDKIITSRRNSCPLTPVVSKASAGAMEVMDVFSTDDLTGFLQVASENTETLQNIHLSSRHHISLLCLQHLAWRVSSACCCGRAGGAPSRRLCWGPIPSWVLRDTALAVFLLSPASSTFLLHSLQHANKHSLLMLLISHQSAPPLTLNQRPRQGHGPPRSPSRVAWSSSGIGLLSLCWVGGCPCFCAQITFPKQLDVQLGNPNPRPHALQGMRGQLLLTILPRRQLPPGLESLNVSVAAGILLHSICSQWKGFPTEGERRQLLQDLQEPSARSERLSVAQHPGLSSGSEKERQNGS